VLLPIPQPSPHTCQLIVTNSTLNDVSYCVAEAVIDDPQPAPNPTPTNEEGPPPKRVHKHYNIYVNLIGHGNYVKTHS